MSGDFERRLKALEDKLNIVRRPSGLGFKILHVGGCFTPPGEIPAFANCGALWWLRNPDEELEAFATRCANDVPAGESEDLIIGSLPRNEEQFAHAMVAYDRWLATDGGVPPCEEGPIRQRRGIV
jgi:hypothetical protein